eukprot:3772765-Rhodomonas_salina.1
MEGAECERDDGGEAEAGVWKLRVRVGGRRGDGEQHRPLRASRLRQVGEGRGREEEGDKEEG